jgi:membrane protease YdiL (CAAX protease family)
MENPTEQPQHPAGVVLMMLLMLLLLSMMVGQGLIYLMEQWQGIGMRSLMAAGAMEYSSPERNILRFQVIVNQLFSFVVPAVLLSFILVRSGWLRMLKLDWIPQWAWFGAGVLWLIVALPLVQVVYWLNQQLPLPSEMLQMEESAQTLIAGFLTMETFAELLLSLLAMAVLPAIGEEFVFRGIIQQNLERMFKSPHLAVWIGAIIFSAFHLQFQGFMPRMLLGALLGYLFLWSRSLWVPILAHGVYNGAQVLAAYALDLDLFKEQDHQMERSDWALSAISFIFVFWLGFQLQQRSKQRAFDGSESN